MKITIGTLFYLLMSYTLYAQNKPVGTVPLAFREVSGIVKDSAGVEVEGLSVLLVSAKDTLQTTTNGQGVFIFKNVKSAEFIITVSGIGFLKKSQRYLNNDTKPRLVLKPFVLRSEQQLLREVDIKGKVGPKYLKDTVEFWAADYIIRDYARLEDLLRKMEGVSVDKDGTVTYQGHELKRAKFNGINYFGGDLKSAIKELPANIVERIQIIDDYGDQAAATGIKTGEPGKVLNVVSKADKSVGTMYGLTTESNFNDRYYAGGSFKRVDGYRQVGINTSAGRIPSGVRNGPAVGTISNSRLGYSGLSGTDSNINGGKINHFDGGLTYNNKLSDQLTFESNYSFKKSNSRTFKKRISAEYYNDGQVNGSHELVGDYREQSHFFKGLINYNPGKSDQLIVSADLGYAENKTASDQKNLQKGMINIAQRSISSSETKSPGYNASALYTHSFETVGSSFSLQLGSSSRKEEEDRMDDNFFNNSISGAASNYELHNLRDISRLNSNHSLQLVYSHPINKFLKIGLVGALNYASYNNRQQVKNVGSDGMLTNVDSLSRIFDYQTINNPLGLKFAYSKNTWYELNFGIKLLGSHMRGAFKTFRNLIQRDAYNLVPEFDLRFSSNKKMEFKLAYAALVQQPSFDQVLPIPELTDPLNTRFGNPGLKSALVHRPSIGYTMYSTASKIQLSLNASASFTNHKVVSNQILIEDPKLGIRRETHYVNSNGDYNLMTYYSVSKSFEDSRYAIQMNGTLNYSNSISMSNGLRNTGKTYTISQFLSFSATPVSWLDLSPGIKFNLNRTAFTLAGFPKISSSITGFNAHGNLYFSKLLVFGFDVGKSLVRGLSVNGTQNPFIVNLSIEKRMFKQKNGMLSLVLMDALKQNNITSRNLTANGFVDSRPNMNSRYFLVQFSWNPQQWSAGKNAEKARKRDGMFLD
ncbi:hypothetical protein DBR43_29350 [Pedobacter sp. KBW06]|uniref:TonB-dependent receptor n=1 Tax=Pedobacter sp. KBW06 TaxID=2153359 RepID=UPI000F5ACD7D|nr:TonB-dependent receptor [Pedobacter sp. KBW06]RQO66331.1 hypothetical protein DBR43_29350 [Pedobacter sp. KBW06]